MQLSDLHGAHLDYWTARADGIPADQLDVELVPRIDLPATGRLARARDGFHGDSVCMQLICVYN
ncbi:hypothetical protein RBA41_28530 [Massilia sp. CCM 9210]|uniref:hypothetical protein n=1 Tax=Massilia scottii TaxID=3057166 RepID=UPI002796CE47|nr:hypothetical protein [Massilia sp. CCM 9210]MDQ1817258.1 hypothetical protein [Massilia sp. CCM 9210]